MPPTVQAEKLSLTWSGPESALLAARLFTQASSLHSGFNCFACPIGERSVHSSTRKPQELKLGLTVDCADQHGLVKPFGLEAFFFGGG